MTILDDLNDAQREAAIAIDGPVLMLAGAGSGKTKTLTHRIAYLLIEKKVAPSDILAVTFTNKAASEMRERIAKLMGTRADSWSFLPFLGTFHGIANRILRREAELIGYPGNFLIYDTADSQAVIKQILRARHIDEKMHSPGLMLNLISSAKNELLSPGQYKDLAVGKMQEMAAEIYPSYQKALREAGAMDFDDMIMQFVRLLRENPETLAKYQEQLKYIMVDEYQDTNHAQYQLIRMLAAAHHNICVVGDDWQSIYSWRGANYENILNFEKDYPEARVVKLEQNYRSTQTILDAAHSVITKNTSRSDKKLWTDLGLGAKIVCETVGDELQEGRFVVETIERAKAQNPHLSLSDFAVLYRTNAQSRSLEESFLRYNMPYQIIGGVRFYERKEIKDMLAYLRFLYQPGDLVSLSRIINLPPRGLGDTSLNKFFSYVRAEGVTALEVLKDPNQVPGLTPRAARSFEQFSVLIEGLRADVERLSLSDLIEATLRRSGYQDWLSDGSAIAEDRLENLQEFIGVAKSYDHVGLEDFLTEIALIADVDQYKKGSESVTLMTLHAAKGLEFDTVFMVGMEEGVFPHSRTFFEPSELEEERRLCYVGMTRAKQQLYMISSISRMLYGTSQHNAPSRFLSDIPSNLVTITQPVTHAAPSILSSFMQQVPSTGPTQAEIELEAGEQVIHPTFGKGVVMSRDGHEAIVKFESAGRKTLNLEYAPLRKA